MINKMILLGRVGKDPEMFKDNAVARFSVATENSFKDKSGNWQNETEWTDCVGFGDQAKRIKDTVHKGDMIFVEGRKTSNTVTKEGVAKTYVSCNIERFRVVASTATKAEKQEVASEEPPWLQ